MKNNKYKILVLSDLKKSVESELKSTISLAKMIDGEITLLHVKKPIDLVGRESQLSAMRTINEQQVNTSNKLGNLIRSCRKDFGVKIDRKIVIGNLKNEIESYLDTYKPDIVVMGKRKSNSFSIIGDNVIKLVLKKHKGPLMIAGNDTLNPTDEVSLGVLNTDDTIGNVDFIDEFLRNTKRPVKKFTIAQSGNKVKNTSVDTIGTNAVEYVFDDTLEAIENVSKYASKSNINLMFADKTDATVKNLMDKLDVSLLLTEKHSTILQN